MKLRALSGRKDAFCNAEPEVNPDGFQRYMARLQSLFEDCTDIRKTYLRILGPGDARTKGTLIRDPRDVKSEVDLTYDAEKKEKGTFFVNECGGIVPNDINTLLDRFNEQFGQCKGD